MRALACRTGGPSSGIPDIYVVAVWVRAEPSAICSVSLGCPLTPDGAEAGKGERAHVQIARRGDPQGHGDQTDETSQTEPSYGESCQESHGTSRDQQRHFDYAMRTADGQAIWTTTA